MEGEIVARGADGQAGKALGDLLLQSEGGGGSHCVIGEVSLFLRIRVILADENVQLCRKPILLPMTYNNTAHFS